MANFHCFASTSRSSVLTFAQWLFLIEGAVTVICAVPAYWILPNYPATTKWLSEQERALAVWRLSIEADGEEDTVQGSVWKGLKEACSDLKVWLLVIIQTGAVMGMSFVRPPPQYRLWKLLTLIDVFLPEHRRDTGLSSSGDAVADRTSVFCRLHLCHRKQLALW